MLRMLRMQRSIGASYAGHPLRPQQEQVVYFEACVVPRATLLVTQRQWQRRACEVSSGKRRNGRNRGRWRVIDSKRDSKFDLVEY